MGRTRLKALIQIAAMAWIWVLAQSARESSAIRELYDFCSLYDQDCHSKRSQQMTTSPKFGASDIDILRHNPGWLTNRLNFCKAEECLTTTVNKSACEICHGWDIADFSLTSVGLRVLAICLSTPADFEAFVRLYKQQNVRQTAWLLLDMNLVHDPLRFFETELSSNDQGDHRGEGQEQTFTFLRSVTMADLVVHVHTTSSRSELRITEIYTIGKELILKELGHYGSDDSTFADLIAIGNSKRRGNFRGSKINIVVQPEPIYYPQQMFQEDEHGNLELANGSVIQTFFDLQFMLNFTYQVVRGDGWIAPDPEDPEKLLGMGGQILKETADIGVTLSTISETRLRKLRFLQPLSSIGGSIYYRQYYIYAQENVAFIPFTYSVWVAYIGAWALMFAISLADWLLGVLWRHHDDHNLVWANLMEITSIMTLAGWTAGESRLTRRIQTLTGYLLSTLVFAYYSSEFYNVASDPKPMISSFDDFAKYHYSIITNPRYMSFVHQFVKDKEHLNIIIETSRKNFVSEADMLQQLRSAQSQLAYITNEVTFMATFVSQNVSDREICEISNMHARHLGKRAIASWTRDAMFLAKDSPYVEFFNFRTLFIMERGLHRRYWKFAKRLSQPMCVEVTFQLLPLRFDQYRVIFGFLLGFTFLSMTLLTLEKVHHYRNFQPSRVHPQQFSFVP